DSAGGGANGEDRDDRRAAGQREFYRAGGQKQVAVEERDARAFLSRHDAVGLHQDNFVAQERFSQAEPEGPSLIDRRFADAELMTKGRAYLLEARGVTLEDDVHRVLASQQRRRTGLEGTHVRGRDDRALSRCAGGAVVIVAF